MIRGGLVSITFRQLSPTEIIKLVAKAGLEGIEWGGDVHVPHGQTALARKVGDETRDAGLTSCAYGSYYRVCESPKEGLSFNSVLDTAKELGTSMIRVWSGAKGSAEADGDYRKQVADELRRIGDISEKQDVAVSLEFHGGSLTDTAESALDLIKSVNHPNVWLYWQPPLGLSSEKCVAGIETLRDRISNLHVFCWSRDGEGYVRHPLAGDAEKWARYLGAVRLVKRERFALLEFVKDDSPEQFLEDAATLKAWLA